ncbi:hypothetical protein BC937DRAFT_90883 [Endogone sp. FLAS-F59071]|nr:hypothetical protein BC937DRAFT_90883 [Endogone sp. FLAS-F59071]|eukprot:RUS21968.1 hypothetical protein BC937DRAFT_90883 [Endogone sp. FLAS-F59071]
MDLDKPLDEIIKQNKVQKKAQKKPNPNQNGNVNGNNSNNNGNNSNSKNNSVNGHSGGPIRTRNATKRITKQKASPYAVCLASSVTSSDAPLYCSRKIVRPRSAFVNEIAELRPVTASTSTQWRHDKFPGNSDPSSLIITKTISQSGASIQNRLGGGLLTARKATTTAKKNTSTMVADRLGMAQQKVTTIKGVAKGKQTEFSIKGEAGPASIVITNLDPGAIADDVKTAFLEFGDILTCTLRYDQAGRSIGTAEIQFAQKASALAAINKYDNAIADGRVLKVQLRATSTRSSPLITAAAAASRSAAAAPRVKAEVALPFYGCQYTAQGYPPVEPNLQRHVRQALEGYRPLGWENGMCVGSWWNCEHDNCWFSYSDGVGICSPQSEQNAFRQVDVKDEGRLLGLLDTIVFGELAR